MCVAGGMGGVRVCSGRRAPNSTVQRGNSVGVQGRAACMQAWCWGVCVWVGWVQGCACGVRKRSRGE